jgi:hypothetical protein
MVAGKLPLIVHALRPAVGRVCFLFENPGMRQPMTFYWAVKIMLDQVGLDSNFASTGLYPLSKDRSVTYKKLFVIMWFYTRSNTLYV